MKILVTGATGFVGSHLSQALLNQGRQVRMLGRNFDHVRKLAALGAQPIVADLRDRNAVIAACNGVDAVYHVGALSAAWGSRKEFYAVNVSGTEAVVAACLQHRVRRLIHISSPSVIFDGRDHHQITESVPYPRRFSSVYAETKKLGEDVVNQAREAGLDTVIIRPKAIFGPGDRTLLPRLIAMARSNSLRQIGDGNNLVDLTYVDNVVHALLLALDAPQAVGHTYFVTNDEHIPLWGMIRSVLERLHLPIKLRAIHIGAALTIATLLEMHARWTGREPLLTRYTVGILGRTQTYDISAAQNDLGYMPQVSVTEGLQRTLLKYQESP